MGSWAPPPARPAGGTLCHVHCPPLAQALPSHQHVSTFTALNGEDSAGNLRIRA